MIVMEAVSLLLDCVEHTEDKEWFEIWVFHTFLVIQADWS